MKDNTSNDDGPTAHEPDYALRKLIGEDVDIRKIFTAEKIKQCQKIIDTARDDFFEEEKPCVAELRMLVQAGDETKFSQIASICTDIRGQARIFGFSFIADLCAQIVTFAELQSRPAKVRFQVISKFVDALQVAVHHKMHDEGGVLEKELNKIVGELLGKG